MKNINIALSVVALSLLSSLEVKAQVYESIALLSPLKEAPEEEVVVPRTSSVKVMRNVLDGHYVLHYQNNGNCDLNICVKSKKGEVVMEAHEAEFDGEFISDLDLKAVGAGEYFIEVSDGITKEKKRIIID